MTYNTVIIPNIQFFPCNKTWHSAHSQSENNWFKKWCFTHLHLKYIQVSMKVHLTIKISNVLDMGGRKKTRLFRGHVPYQGTPPPKNTQ